MTDKAVASDLNEFTDKCVTLDTGTITDLDTFLDFTEASHHAVSSDFTSVDVHEVPDFGSFTDFAVIDNLPWILRGYLRLFFALFILLENGHFFPPFEAVWNDNRIPNILHTTQEEKLAKKYPKFLYYRAH